MTSTRIQSIPDDLRSPAVLGDVDRAMQMLRGMGVMPATDRVDVMVVEGAPWSKSRPRFSRAGHAYQPRDDRAQAEALAWRMRGFLAERFPANVAVACIFFRPNRQRIDADNMLKHVLDSATGVAWEDDSQVTAVLGVIELDAERPRTVIAFGEHESTMTRGTASNLTCEGCGVSYPRKSSGPQTRYCSPDCSNRGRGMPGIADEVPCAECGKPFKRRTSSQKYCSAPCRDVAQRGRRKSRSRSLSDCTSCGKRLTHNRGGRCRECWRKDPRGAERDAVTVLVEEVGP